MTTSVIFWLSYDFSNEFLKHFLNSGYHFNEKYIVVKKIDQRMLKIEIEMNFVM